MFPQIFLSLKVMFICRKSGAISKFKKRRGTESQLRSCDQPNRSKKSVKLKATDALSFVSNLRTNVFKEFGQNLLEDSAQYLIHLITFNLFFAEL